MDCNQIVFHIITGCTHNCKLCVSGVPYYREQGKSYSVSKDEFDLELRNVFSIFSYINRITVTGGEPLLHPKLEDLLISLMQYSCQFGECRIFTNGSIMPNEHLIHYIALTKGKLSFVVNDYGSKLSPFAEKIRLRTGCRVNCYNGDMQYYGGWVDYGPLNIRYEYSREEAQNMFKNCHFTDWKMYNIFKGKLFYCTRAAIGVDLGFYELDQQDYLDLNDVALSLNEKRDRILQLGKFPGKSCYYCKGFDSVNGIRYPAAEQLEKG